MPYSRPTLAQLNARIQADIKSNLGNDTSILRRSWVSIFGRVIAGGFHLIWGYIQWVYRQLFVVSADDEAIIAKAGVYGITRKPAAYAMGEASFTGIQGVTVPSGTFLVRPEGLRYVTTSSIVLGSTATPAPVRAAEIGSASNYAAPKTLSLESPLAGVDDAVRVSASIGGGVELESIDDLKARYLLRIRRPPQGGAKSDYEQWARELSDVGTVKVYGPGEITETPFVPSVGTVRLYFSTATGDTPTSIQIQEMQDHLDSKKPITATVEVYGTVVRMIQVKVEIKVASGSTFAQARDDAKNNLIDLFSDEAIPTARIPLSKINEAISRPSSVSDHYLILPDDPIFMENDEIGRLDETYYVNNALQIP